MVLGSPGITPASKKIGNDSTYVYADIVNNKVEIWVNGTKVQEWG